VEVLAPRPPPRRRPLLSAVTMVIVLGLVVWGVVARLSTDGEHPPPAAPPPPAASSSTTALTLGPPPWVRYPTPLEGRWVSTRGPRQATLVVHNAYLDLWQGTGQRQGLPLTHRVMVVVGDRVHVRTPGDPSEVATYQWRIKGQRLTFELVDKTPKSAAMLEGLTFERS
jgi:hypothetical protein